MKNLGIQDICMIKHGLAALIANEKVTLKIAIKKGDREQIARSNSYIDEVDRTFIVRRQPGAILAKSRLLIR